MLGTLSVTLVLFTFSESGLVQREKELSVGRLRKAVHSSDYLSLSMNELE